MSNKKERVTMAIRGTRFIGSHTVVELIQQKRYILSITFQFQTGSFKPH